MGLYSILEEINNRVTPAQALRFLSDENTRNYFIQSYPFFDEMAHDEIRSYIDECFEGKMSNSLKIDILDLCVAVNYFNDTIYTIAKTYLFNKSNYLIKLAVLDYMNNFFCSLKKDEYISVNLELNKKTSNTIISFQTSINLTLFDLSKYSKKVFQTLKAKDVPPYFYYRFANTIIFNQFVDIDLKEKFIDILNDRKLSQGQYNDIIRILK